MSYDQSELLQCVNQFISSSSCPCVYVCVCVCVCVFPQIINQANAHFSRVRDVSTDEKSIMICQLLLPVFARVLQIVI